MVSKKKSNGVSNNKGTEQTNGNGTSLQKHEVTHSSVINLHIDESKSKIPDGGWGWFVVIAALFINLAADGAVCTFGFLNVPFLEEFGASASLTSWVGSLFVAVPLLAGPLCSALVDRYGCRLMTICGGLCCTFGFILSSYATSIIMLMFTFGIIGGIGLGFGYVTAVVSVAFWFEKKRTLVLGLAASGTGFGTIVYSPLVTYLIREYNWRGTLLILGGFFANLCVAGCLMRDPDWVKENDGKVTVDAHGHGIKKDIDHSSSPIRKKDIGMELIPKETENSISNDTNKFHSVVDLPTYFKQNKQIPEEVLENINRNPHMHKIITENYPHLLKDTDFQKHEDESQTKTNEFSKSGNEEQNEALLKRNYSSKSGGRRRSSAHSSKNVFVRKNSIAYKSAIVNIYKYNKSTAASCPDFFGDSFTEQDEETYDENDEVLNSLTNFKLLLNFHFFILSLVTMLVNIWFIIPFFYLPHHMKENGYSDDDVATAFLGNGIMTIVGMVGLSWMGDKFDEAKLYSLCLIGCGSSTAAIMFSTPNYWMLIISTSMFGLFFASIFSLTPAITAKLIALDKFTMAFGINLLCHGIGNLIGPPIAGLLYDLTQSYSQSFYQAALWIIISGVLVGLIPFTKNRVLFKGLYMKFAKPATRDAENQK